MHKKLVPVLVGLLATVVVVGQSAFTVSEGGQTLVLQFGKPVAQHTEPGLKFKLPFFQNTITFDKRLLDVDPPPEQVILADQKRLVVDTFARYRITDMLAFHNTMKTEEQAVSRLDNIIHSTLRSVMGTASMTHVLSEKRDGLMEAIRDQVNKSVTNFGVEVVDVRIGRADLPEQTTQAVYSRMKTEREREAAQFRAQGQEAAQEIKSKADRERTVLLADAEKQAQILRGQGDGLAIKIYADAFKRDPQFYAFYRTMQAYKEGLGADNTTLILKPEGEFFRFFKDTQGKR